MLTHYTGQLDSVANIITHGFAWVANRRNLVEILIPHRNYSEREPQQFGMISFTEITPNEACFHSGVFGRYGVVVTDAWAKHQNAQRVIYVDSAGPVTDSLRSIFEIGYRDCEARIRYPEDAGWTMAFENKAVASSVAGAMLWANLLQLYEYMESSQFSGEREWRIVHPDPYYSLAGRRTEQVIRDVSPPQGWANYLNVVTVAPGDIEALVCPSSECHALRQALPPEYANVPLIPIED
jgi:hypothetical protein